MFGEYVFANSECTYGCVISQYYLHSLYFCVYYTSHVHVCSTKIFVLHYLNCNNEIHGTISIKIYAQTELCILVVCQLKILNPQHIL